MYRVLAKRALTSHPWSPPAPIQGLGTKLSREGTRLRLEYVIIGDIARLRFPDPMGGERADDLWQSTCFELFIRWDDQAYQEFNFSPSSQWAAYSFTGYRQGRRDLEVEAPQISVETGSHRFALNVSIDVELPEIAHIGLSTIVETTDRLKSYWALAHPPGEPDFHHPDCFTLELSAPDQP